VGRHGHPQRPAAGPVDGLVVDGTIYFGGGNVSWVRNLQANPRISVHLEDARDAIILEGRVEWTNGPADLLDRIAAASKKLYGWGEPSPCWALRLEVVFAWTDFGKDTTRWIL
jgi:hypothetical protein